MINTSNIFTYYSLSQIIEQGEASWDFRIMTQIYGPTGRLIILAACALAACTQHCPEQCSYCNSLRNHVICDGQRTSLTIFPILDNSSYWMRNFFFINTNIDTLQNGTFLLPHWPFLQEFGFYSNGVIWLNESIFSQSTSIKKLMLQVNKLRKVPTASIKPLEHLIYIDLSSNKIQLVEAYSFNFNPKLQTISLTNIAIYFVHPSIFFGLNNIIYLNLPQNKLSSFPSFLSHSNSLNAKTINLHQNSIDYIYTINESFPACEKLDLSFNKIKVLEKFSLLGFPNLQILLLKHNQISFIHPLIFGGRLNSLTFLDLLTNNITEIPAELLTFVRRLRKLVLSDNLIAEIP